MNLNRDSNAKDFKAQIDIWMDNMPKGRTANWVIGNHDQRRVSNRLGPERIDLMNMVDLCLPGASITYNVSIHLNSQIFIMPLKHVHIIIVNSTKS